MRVPQMLLGGSRNERIGHEAPEVKHRHEGDEVFSDIHNAHLFRWLEKDVPEADPHMRATRTSVNATRTTYRAVTFTSTLSDSD